MENNTQCADLYVATLANFFRVIEAKSGTELAKRILAHADEALLNHNWFINSSTVVKKTLYEPMRSDPVLHLALVKLERLFLARLKLEGREGLYIKAVYQLFFAGNTSNNVVDEDFSKTLGTSNSLNESDLTQIPGLLGLLSVFMFRNEWNRLTWE